MQLSPESPFSISELLGTEVFGMDVDQKNILYKKAMINLCLRHADNCEPYRRLIEVIGAKPSSFESVTDVPFLPVRLFKDFELRSVDRENIVKTLTSSGTTGQKVSKIFLDRENAANQSKVLAKIVGNFIGKRRLPMLVLDSNTIVKDRAMFSARGAGVLGFSMFGQDLTYAFNEQMQLDLRTLEAFLEKHSGQTILVFGFTYIIWQHFYRTLASSGVRLDLKDGLLIHGGGWKKLIEEAVDSDTFKKLLGDVCGIQRVHNYYGMVEQTGSIFMECEAGFFHASIFSDLLIRDHRDFSIVPDGTIGLVQLLSLLPSSYPGHSILSEDLGQVIGVDTCACGRKGKYFLLHGRIKNAEIRGCSDAYTPTN